MTILIAALVGYAVFTLTVQAATLAERIYVGWQRVDTD